MVYSLSKPILIAGILACFGAGVESPSQNKPEACRTWPQFRGAFARGVADCAVPAEWDVEAGKNIRWKSPIPGLGHSSPIVWDRRVFLTTCVGSAPEPTLRVGLYGDIAPVEESEAHRWQVYCLDKETGDVLWQKTACEGVPRIRRHPKSTHANSTPATDGKNVVAFFGSEGLFCYTVDGDLRWKRDLGVLDSGYFVVPDAQWGFGSSPIIYQNMVIIQCDVQGTSFIAALDIENGQDLWRTPRDEVPTWSTPTVWERDDRTQVIVNGFRHIGGYDVRTGAPIWWLAGGGDIPVPTPVTGHDLVYITNAHGGQAPIYAVRSNASGKIELNPGQTSSEQFAWSYERRGNYMQTPILVGDYLFACRDNGALTCFEAKTGKIAGQRRLGSGSTGFTASPVAADGKLYFASEEGDVHVVEAGPALKALAVNRLGEHCMATPAISDGRIFIRGHRHLFCISR